MRRVLVAALVTLPWWFALAVPAPAEAHTVDRFTACVALSPRTPTCERRGAVLDAGATAHLRGRVSPAHPGFGQVWRRAPFSERFVRVGTIGINQQGRVRWRWVTDADDVAPRPYTFQFRIPGHGVSWTTKVRVRRPRPATVSACAAVAATAARCHRAGVTYEWGRTVHLRGQVRPGQATRVTVLRQRPHSHRMEQVATTRAAPDGAVRWTWRTQPRHVDGGAPYRFALRLPTGRRSNLVDIWIVPRHDP